MKDYLAHVSFDIYSSTTNINKIKSALSYDPYNGDVHNLHIHRVDPEIKKYRIEYDVKEDSEKTCYSDAEFMIDERTDYSIDLDFIKSSFKYTLYSKSASPKKASPEKASPKKASPKKASPKKASPKKGGKRCPNGTRRNKKTGHCESTKQKSPSVLSVKLKKKRCPNGTRRNKKTGACEKK
jgi:hypothetical protein